MDELWKGFFPLSHRKKKGRAVMVMVLRVQVVPCK